jgi:hypothetical protein
MKVLEGPRIVDVGADWRAAVEATERRVVVDVGAGDGRWSYEMARGDPETLFVALDPDGAALQEYAFRASRKASRGGVENAVFVAASIESPPAELAGLADEVHVNFPWAALLRGLLLPERDVLRGLRAIAKPGSPIRLVVTYDAGHDHGAGVDPGSGPLDRRALERLEDPYRENGVEIEETRLLTRDEALAIPSTWGRRLLHGRPRDVFEVTARRL